VFIQHCLDFDVYIPSDIAFINRFIKLLFATDVTCIVVHDIGKCYLILILHNF
jgi:hypothetical protein